MIFEDQQNNVRVFERVEHLHIKRLNKKGKRGKKIPRNLNNNYNDTQKNQET